MAGKIHVRANKVLGTHTGANIFCLKFFSEKSVFEMLLLLYECRQRPSKRVEAEVHGARKFQDNWDTSGTRPTISGLSRPFRVGWQIYIYIERERESYRCRSKEARFARNNINIYTDS